MQLKSCKMSLLLTAATLALATAPGYSQPDIVPPLKEQSAAELRLMILDKLKAALGDWAYPGGELQGGGGAGARMELSCNASLTTKDPIAQVWAYYVNKTPPIKKMEFPPTAAANLKPVPNAEQMPWALATGFTLSAGGGRNYTWLELPSPPRHHATIMVTQEAQTILVPMWEKPAPDKLGHQTDIQVVMLKSTPSEANITRLPLTAKPDEPIAR